MKQPGAITHAQQLNTSLEEMDRPGAIMHAQQLVPY
jgi:hypothetical protein